jgi:hypothetical protein
VRNSFLVPASNAQVTSAIKVLLPRFGDEEFLFGVTKVFFKEYAYTVLKRKYAKL